MKISKKAFGWAGGRIIGWLIIRKGEVYFPFPSSTVTSVRYTLATRLSNFCTRCVIYSSDVLQLSLVMDMGWGIGKRQTLAKISILKICGEMQNLACLGE